MRSIELVERARCLKKKLFFFPTKVRLFAFFFSSRERKKRRRKKRKTSHRHASSFPKLASIFSMGGHWPQSSTFSHE